jgi:hypothetical protein
MKSIEVIDVMSSFRPGAAGLYENAKGASVATTFGVMA